MGNGFESEREGSVSPFAMKWNSVQARPIRWRSPPPIRITTELRTLVPQVDLGPSMTRLAPKLENAWDTGRVKAGAFAQAASFPPRAELLALVRPVKGVATNVLALAMVPYLAPSVRGPIDLQAARTGLQVSFDSALAPAVTNTIKPLPVVLNRVATRPEGRATSLLLWELASTVRRAGGHLTESLARRREQALALWNDVQRALDAALLPLPAPVPAAIPTRGGAARVRGKKKLIQLRSVSAVVLDPNWEPERTIELPVRKSPEIHDGQLSMALDVEDASFAGRLADLVLVAGGIEIALTSATIEPQGQAATVSFELDLGSAGIRVTGGAFPESALRVVVEPRSEQSPTWSKRGGKSR